MLESRNHYNATTVNYSVRVLEISGGEMTDIDKMVDWKMSWLSRDSQKIIWQNLLY